jgi:mono/diheme cytochrome c family protein
MDDADRTSPTIAIFLDAENEPIATYRPPVTFTLDTTTIEDGDHLLRIRAIDSLGKVSTRTMAFSVQNGPGITVTGLRDGARVSGRLDLNVNAFGANEPFDPERAESPGPIPVWTWIMIVLIGLWSAWYGIEYFATPPAFAQTPTYAANPVMAAALSPSSQTAVQTAAPIAKNAAVGSKNVAGFDFSTLGSQVYAQNCMSCHGQNGAGTPGIFPALAADPVVNGKDANAHIAIVLKGLSGKTIKGVSYAAQMPAFASRLSDSQIAAVVDHERTSWGNNGPTVTPAQVTKVR